MVDVGSVIDSVDHHDSFSFEDFVNDSIRAAPFGMKSGKFGAKGTNWVGCVT
jgi:hypothetical protein